MLIKPTVKSPWPSRLILLGVVAAIVGMFFLVRAFNSAGQSLVQLQNAMPGQHIEAIGEDVLWYDGTMLHRLAPNGTRRWFFQAGQAAGFHTSGKRLVVWSANQLYILDPNTGTAVFNDRMDSVIQFARAGTNYIAAFVGEPDSGWLYVMDGTGKRVDTVEIAHTALMDVGFFSQAREMMWVLGLEVDGTVPATTLQTYDPGSLVTGSTTLGEQLAYRVYFHNALLRVVDTRQIRTYDYRIKEQAQPVLIYGWYMQDVRPVNRDVVQLLVPMPSEDGMTGFSDLRLIHGSMDRVLHLPASCTGALLGSKAVYAFSGSTLYTARYGEFSFTASDLPVNVSRVIGITQNDCAIVGDGGSVYLVRLPT